MNTSRYLPWLANSLFLAGLTVGALGLHPENQDTGAAAAGFFIAIAALPAVIAWLLGRNQRVADAQLSTAHRVGYQQALEHVARGLLDQPTAPPNPGERLPGEQAAGNVIQLRPSTDDRSERKAL
ncbi:hypothetical protein ACQF36_41400 [Streptomyces sp. Marseille-Q5077]|uniref:hypothetical protein n=1 Tax=Streptomyces sp. Marseille-Q5077 TaxID=3418995 RepID=UPI003D08578D